MFKDFLTTEGERLLAKSIAGNTTITFTKMMIGDGDRGTSTKTITSLASPRMTLDLYSVLISGDNNIEITTILDSSAIPEGFYFREKGIYATDGTTEILFMYGTSGSLAEWIENLDNAVFTRTIRTVITLSESDNVKITIQKGAYASGEDAENILAAIQSIDLDGDWAKYSQAESILSILDTFVAAYTVLRAGKLDNLDALVSSRAPANTALSNATWTNTRAALLDNLDAKISSRAQASTALSNAVWTNARAGYLDAINASVALLTAARAGYIDLIPGISNGFNALNNRVKGIDFTKLMSGKITYQTLGETTILSYSGGGVLHGIISEYSPSKTGNVFGFKVIIDGVTILNQQTDSASYSRTNFGIVRADTLDSNQGNSSASIYAYCPVYSTGYGYRTVNYNGSGPVTESGIVVVPEPIVFKSSLVVIAKLATVEYAANISYQFVKD